jgi:hypothetical protein
VAREEDAMLDRMSQNTKAPACDDNGASPLALRRSGPPRTVLTVAGRTCQAVLLSYVAKGVMIVSNSSKIPPVIAA